MGIPYLRRDERGATLMVDDKPYLALGGETHNSSASSLEYMAREVWPRLRGMHLNTLIVPVSWELTEPEDGMFDFSLPDGLIAQAENEHMRLVILWFGLWKNGISTYVPGWMKRDKATYFLMRRRDGAPVNAISPFCDAAVERDARAFAALMAHLREHDTHRTVILAQVENEMGLLGDTRDFGTAAQSAYAAPVPGDMRPFAANDADTWEEAFGQSAPEMFMTRKYALATERIASAGKRAYPLPMYVNAWLEQFPWTPGTYPCGGPVARHMDVWKALAPSVDFLAPDIYLPDFEAVCREYTARDNPLFIPEARPCMDSASNVFAAFGQYGALGFSPFAIEDVAADCPPPDPALLRALSIHEEAFNCYHSGIYLKRSYHLLSGMLDLIGERRGTPHMRGFTRGDADGALVCFARYDFQVTYAPRDADAPKGGGLIMEMDEDTFVVCGTGFRAKPLPKNADGCLVEIVSIDEGVFEDGVWKPGRRLNGDEYFVRVNAEPSALLVHLTRYKA